MKGNWCLLPDAPCDIIQGKLSDVKGKPNLHFGSNLCRLFLQSGQTVTAAGTSLGPITANVLLKSNINGNPFFPSQLGQLIGTLAGQNIIALPQPL